MSARPHFHLAGIPIRVEPMFWFITALFGYQLGSVPVVITWVAVVLVSILVHELGHALALAAFGQRSSIVIHGFGGLTLSQRRLGRLQSIAVSVAGPGAALFALGLPAMWVVHRFGDDLARDWVLGGGGFGWYPVLRFAGWVNVWWSLANLLPIRPLDGGNVATEVIGIQRARLLSIVVGAGAAVGAFAFAPELRFAALFAAFLAFANYGEYSRAKAGPSGPSAFDVDAPAPKGGGGVLPGHHGGPRARRSGPPLQSLPTGPTAARPTQGVDPAIAQVTAWNHLRRDDANAALAVLGRAGGEVDPFVRPVALAASTGSIDDLVAAYLTHPNGPDNLVTATVLARRGLTHPVTDRLLSAGTAAGRDAVASLQTHLHYGEHFAEAAAVGARLFASAPSAPAQVAFDVATAASRAGDVDRALDWLGRAIDAGFGAGAMLDGDPDLAAVRADPRWPAIRHRLA